MDNHGLDGKNIRKILVIGATGFVGSRLAERLQLLHAHSPKCLIRDYSKLARLARFKSDIVFGDILDPSAYEKEVADCDVYVFCAHGKESDSKLNWEINTQGLKKIIELAVRNKVKHFIFLSTTAIYEEKSQNGTFDESIVPICNKKDYAGGKLEGEKICLKYYAEHGLPVTILRPTIIYGPFAPSWTIYPAELVSRGVVKDYGTFSGFCNPVYIDDVVDVIIKCMLNKLCYGETFIVSSGEVITWKEFYNAFSIAIRKLPLEKSNRTLYLAKTIPTILIKNTVKAIVKRMPKFSKSVYRLLKERGSGDWSWVKGQDISTLEVSFYKKKLTFSIEKLKSILDYKPQFTFQAGMKITEGWLRYQGYVNMDIRCKNSVRKREVEDVI